MLDRTQRFVLWFPRRSASDLYSFKSKAKYLRYVELTIILKSSIAPPDGTTDNSLFTACNQSLWQGNAFTPVCNSVHRGRGLYPGEGAFCPGDFCPKGGLCPCGLCPGGSLSGDLCPWGFLLGGSLSSGSLSRASLSRGVSVKEVSLSRRGLCPGGCICSRESLSSESLSGGVSVQGGLCPG